MGKRTSNKIPLLARKSKDPSPLITTLENLCFPCRCLLCHAPLTRQRLRICEQCLPDLPLLHRPICPHCGTIFPDSGSDSDHLCGICRQQPWDFDKGRALLAYTDQVGKLIHAFKFQGQRTALASFNELAHRSELLHDLSEPDLIIPVPLHPSRLRHRGFNQAAVLAASLFPHQRHKICHDLQRSRATTPQTGLSGKERRQNVVGSFSILHKEIISNHKILLVDDVFTTGSTINECAKILKKAGASQVEVVTLAMAIQRN